MTNLIWWVLPALSAVIGLLLSFAGLGRLMKLRLAAGGLRFLFGIGFMGLAGIVTFAGLNLQTYKRLTNEQDVALVRFDAAPGFEDAYIVTLEYLDEEGAVRTLPDPALTEGDAVYFAGDEFSIGAQVVTFKPMSQMLGFDSVYRLDYMEGRFTDRFTAERVTEATSTGIKLFENPGLDVHTLAKQQGRRLGLSAGRRDANFGSAVYAPMADGLEYKISLSQSALVLRAENDAAQRALSRVDQRMARARLPQARREPPYLPFMDGPPSFKPKLRPITPDCWLTPDTEAGVWLKAKQKLMRDHREEIVSGDTDGIAAREAARLVFEAVGDMPQSDWPSALERASAVVSDDLCVVEDQGRGDWRLTSGVLAAPTYWRLRERIGLDLGGLHSDVPGGDPKLARRIRRVFSALRPGAMLERLNWTVQIGPERYLPERPPVGETIPADLFLRVERQTIRKLPASEAVLFTIRVCVDPLLPILEEDDAREAFEDAWLLAPKPVRQYKGWQALERLVKQACRRTALSGL